MLKKIQTKKAELEKRYKVTNQKKAQLQANVPLTDIQALLGHSRATTTDLYLQSLGFSSRLDSLSKLEFPA